jgi:hypothetical protein
MSAHITDLREVTSRQQFFFSLPHRPSDAIALWHDEDGWFVELPVGAPPFTVEELLPLVHDLRAHRPGEVRLVVPAHNAVLLYDALLETLASPDGSGPLTADHIAALREALLAQRSPRRADLTGPASFHHVVGAWLRLRHAAAAGVASSLTDVPAPLGALFHHVIDLILAGARLERVALRGSPSEGPHRGVFVQLVSSETFESLVKY